MPIYTYRCKKCLLEFDAQHSMNHIMKQHDEVENEPCNGIIERAQDVVITTDYSPPTGERDLEYRMREHFEDVKEALHKDREPIKVSEEEIKRNMEKNGNRISDRD